MGNTLTILLSGFLATVSIAQGLLLASSGNAMSAPEPIAHVEVLSAARVDIASEEEAHTTTPSIAQISPHEEEQKTAAKTVKRTEKAFAILPVVDQDDIHAGDKVLLTKILQWMPPVCRLNLQDLVVRYASDAERGLATSSTILLKGNMPRAETIAVLIHECGHVVDLGALQGSVDAGTSPYPDGTVPTYNNDPSVLFYQISWRSGVWKKRDAQNEDFVSGYAKEDPFEDLAETVAYYALQNSAFRERAENNEALAKKYEWVETYVFGPNFVLPESVDWDGKIVWDVTKLAHNLDL